jgi:hypothetical protein
MQSPYRRRKIIATLRDEATCRKEYFEQLAASFKEAEELQNAEALYSIFYIYKNIVSHGDQKVVETLLSDDYYIDFFGALESKFFGGFKLFVGDPNHLN